MATGYLLIPSIYYFVKVIEHLSLVVRGEEEVFLMKVWVEEVGLHSLSILE